MVKVGSLVTTQVPYDRRVRSFLVPGFFLATVGCSSPGAVRAVVDVTGFRPGCLKVMASDSREPAHTGEVTLSGHEDGPPSTWVIAVYQKIGWSPELTVTTEALEGDCAGSVAASSTQNTRFPDGRIGELYFSLEAFDRDGDGFADRNTSTGGTDCDDQEPDVHPKAPEACGDRQDNDCDGKDECAAGLCPDFCDPTLGGTVPGGQDGGTPGDGGDADSGIASPDGGNPPADAGTTPQDGGAPPGDGGSPQDAGSAPADGGTDGGPGQVDAGLCSVDGWCPVASPAGNKTVTAVFGLATSEIWVVGLNGLVLRWNGVSWTDRSLQANKEIHAVWAGSPTDVWVAGAAGALFHWYGPAWQDESQSGQMNFNGVWGVSGGPLFVVGDNGKILTRSPSGVFVTSNPTTERLNGVDGRSGSNVWAVGDNGTILRFDGTSWEGEPSPTSLDLRGVWASGSGSVLAVGGGFSGTGSQAPAGVAVRYSSGTWNEEPLPAAQVLYGVVGSGSGQRWIVGERGQVFTRIGSSWEALSSGTTATLLGVWGAGGSEAWAVGSGGTILRHGP